jgi:hypothetical protein
MVATTFQARRADRRFQLVRQLANTVLFDLHDQVEKLPGSTSVRAAMLQTVVRYLDSLAQDSAGDPTLDLEIAKAYSRVAAAEGHPRSSSLGQTVVALGHYQKALEIFERLSGRAETRAEALRNLAGIHIETASVEEVLGRLQRSPNTCAKRLRLRRKQNDSVGRSCIPAPWFRCTQGWGR